MSINKETLQLYNDWEEARAAFVAAKEKAAKNPKYRDSDEYQKIADKVREMRAYWRDIRDAMAPSDGGDAVATPASVATKSGVNQR